MSPVYARHSLWLLPVGWRRYSNRQDQAMLIVAERTKAALRHKRSKNEKTGGRDVPFGFNLADNGLLVTNEAERKAISLMLELRDKGYSLRAIAQELEKEGYKTRRGNTKWHPQTINQIIRSETKRVEALRMAA
jgi:hypothetical protein